MDTLAETSWDVILAGTGLPQALLALWVQIPRDETIHR